MSLYPTVTLRERGRFNCRTTSAQRTEQRQLGHMAAEAFRRRQGWRIYIDRAAAFAADDRGREWIDAGRRDGGRVEENHRKWMIENGHPPPGEGFLE